ncbi:MAG: PilZ domain-containing protein [bacterium]
MEGSQRSEATPRLPVELEVDCATEQMSEPVTLTTQDVGEGGLFLKTEFPLDPGTRFGCRFHIGSEPLLAEGEVAWIRNGPPEDDPPPGMGVRFVAVDPADAHRLQAFVSGAEPSDGALAVDDEALPRVTFRLHGVGNPIPGEFRAMSDNGLAAVAELPFLQVGSTVQVTIDEPGSKGPKAGRIAWLALEREDEEDEGQVPRIRLGIHFDDTLEAASQTAADWSRSNPAPVPLTTRKSGAEADSGARAPSRGVSAQSPCFDETCAAPDYDTPWNADFIDQPRPPARASRARRRVRSRQPGVKLNMTQAWQTLRERAAQSPRVAMGVIAGGALLVLVALTAFAFSGSGRKQSKSKAGKTAAAKQPPSAPVIAEAPPAAPTPGGAQAGAPGVPAAEPPLPASGPSGRRVLTSGPGVNADPGKVLGQGAMDPGKELLADPDKPTSGKPRPKQVYHYTVGQKLVVKLALQGKPGPVKHYLLANPNGAVIDVAGAAPSLKPGRYKVGDRRVRMVKVLHRGSAARFIVYYGTQLKKPTISLVPTADAVNFVLTGPRAARKPQVAKRTRAVRGLKTKRRPQRLAKRNKLRRVRPKRTVRKPPRRTVRRRVAPVADATD